MITHAVDYQWLHTQFDYATINNIMHNYTNSGIHIYIVSKLCLYSVNLAVFFIDTVIMLAELCLFLQILGLVLLVCVSYARVRIILCITVQSCTFC